MAGFPEVEIGPRGLGTVAGTAPAERYVRSPDEALDDLLDLLVGLPQDVLAQQGQLRDRLRASTAAADSSLSRVLRHIVLAARNLARARYAALGVIGRDGRLDRFVHAGMDDDAVARIGALPQGHGVLGLPSRFPGPARLADLTAHTAAAGFPPNHPRMRSYLGVPIPIRQQVFGSLYVTEAASGEFTSEDERIITALAVTAGVAIEQSEIYRYDTGEG
jgi:GAF domain-containing protein